jgi:hypothetical protein
MPDNLPSKFLVPIDKIGGVLSVPRKSDAGLICA